MLMFTTSSHHSTKPNVGCCTSLAETAMQQARSRLNNTLNDLIESNATANFKIINALEEVDLMLCKLLKDEKQMLIYFHIGVMKQGLITENDAKWQEGYLPKIEKEAEQYFNNTFKK